MLMLIVQVTGSDLIDANFLEDGQDGHGVDGRDDRGEDEQLQQTSTRHRQCTQLRKVSGDRL